MMDPHTGNVRLLQEGEKPMPHEVPVGSPVEPVWANRQQRRAAERAEAKSKAKASKRAARAS